LDGRLAAAGDQVKEGAEKDSLAHHAADETTDEPRPTTIRRAKGLAALRGTAGLAVSAAAANDQM
jgi:hypothetical protein